MSSTWIAAVRVQSPVSFPQQHVCASRGHTAAPGPLPFPPPLLWKVFPASSLPTARHASSSFTSGFRRGKKDSSLPQKPSVFPTAQASPPCLGCAFAREGGLNSSCHQPAAHPGLRGGLRLLQNWQPPGGHQPCSHLLWDTLVRCGTAHSKTAAGQVAVAWILMDLERWFSRRTRVMLLIR